MSETTITIPYWLPSSGLVAFWLVCGGIHAAMMAVMKVREDLHADWLRIHGIEAEKGRLTLLHVATALALGPVGLGMGIHFLFFIQPKRFSHDTPEAIWKRIEADS